MSLWTEWRNSVIDGAKQAAKSSAIKLVTIKLFGRAIDVDRSVRKKLREQKAQIIGLEDQLKESGNIIAALQKELFILRNEHNIKTDHEEIFDFEEF